MDNNRTLTIDLDKTIFDKVRNTLIKCLMNFLIEEVLLHFSMYKTVQQMDGLFFVQ